MGSRKSVFGVEVVVVVVMVVAIMWCGSFPMASAQVNAPGFSELGPCWFTIDDCLSSHENDTTNPKYDPSNPSFDQSEFWCCSLIQDTFQNHKSCFCTISTYLHQAPSGPDNVELLSFCKTISSLDDFDATCAGVISSPAPAPMAL